MTRLAWVDVFASAPMTGNPLAVVLDADDWPASRMQALATELGISETAFALPATGDGDRRLRIFTPARELPIAGHPVVGAAWVLHAAGLIGPRARLDTRAGPVAVRVRGAIATADLGTVAPGPSVDPAEVAAAVGIAPPPDARIWSVGVPQLMLAAPDAEAVAAARPDHAALCRLGERDGWLGVSVYAVDASDPDRLSADVRHFAPLLGVPEDPVTGSAAAALGGCLAAAGAAAGEALALVVRQATAAGRGGEVAVRVGAGDGRGAAPVQVGGQVVPLFEGRMVDDA